MTQGVLETTTGRESLAIPIADNETEFLDLVCNFFGTKIGLVTPLIAGWILRLNTRNRPITQSEVKRYIGILQQRQWKVTGETIIISREGIVNDGQHRVLAIAQSGISAPCVVMFGVEREAFEATGVGTRRTVGQILSLSGIPNGNTVAAIAKMLWHFDRDAVTALNLPVEAHDIRAIIAETPWLVDIGHHVVTSSLLILRRSWIGGALAFIARRTDVDVALAFGRAVNDGQGDPRDGARVLHMRLIKEELSRAKTPTIDRLAYTILAFNAWAEVRPISRLQIDDSHRTAKGFPMITSRVRRRVA